MPIFAVTLRKNKTLNSRDKMPFLHLSNFIPSSILLFYTLPYHNTFYSKIRVNLILLYPFVLHNAYIPFKYFAGLEGVVNNPRKCTIGKVVAQEKKLNKPGEPEEVIRVRIPQKRKQEVLGIVDKMLGGRRVIVQCLDGVERMGRIPGRLKRRQWVAVGDVVIVVPWDFQDGKGDVIYRYTRPQVEWLRKKGYLK
jgi:translation initiation factor 1A